LERPSLTVPADVLQTLFPFHIALDRELKIVDLGAKLTRLRPQVKIGDPLGDHVILRRPPQVQSFEQICQRLDALYVLEVRDSAAQLRGQMVSLPGDALLFVGQPLARNLQEVKALGLKLKDFPLYDPSGDLLFLVQAQQTTIDEARALTKRLTQQSEAFRRYVPQEFLRLLQKESVLNIKLGDCVERKMTVLFSDIRSFTTLSESMSPQANFEFINSYLRAMEPVVSRHQGFIDKFIGDAIMALFDREADDAVRAAIDMLHTLGDYNGDRRGQGNSPIQIGIGINTGNLMLGTIGGEEHMEGTVISDAVNLASRVESLTKTYGVELLVSENARAAMADPSAFQMREIDHVRVRGKTKPVTLYEVCDADPPEVREGKRASLPEFAEALAHFYEGRLEGARAAWQECVRICAHDKAARLHVERCDAALSPRSGKTPGSPPG
jgi:class 3 adenylate cyclase